MQLSVASFAEAQQLETATCKVSVYRDELALDWSSQLLTPPLSYQTTLRMPCPWDSHAQSTLRMKFLWDGSDK